MTIKSEDFKKKYQQMTYMELATHYGVSISTIYNFVKKLKLNKGNKKIKLEE